MRERQLGPDRTALDLQKQWRGKNNCRSMYNLLRALTDGLSILLTPECIHSLNS